MRIPDQGQIQNLNPPGAEISGATLTAQQLLAFLNNPQAYLQGPLETFLITLFGQPADFGAINESAIRSGWLPREVPQFVFSALDGPIWQRLREMAGDDPLRIPPNFLAELGIGNIYSYWTFSSLLAGIESRLNLLRGDPTKLTELGDKELLVARFLVLFHHRIFNYTREQGELLPGFNHQGQGEHFCGNCGASSKFYAVLFGAVGINSGTIRVDAGAPGAELEPHATALVQTADRRLALIDQSIYRPVTRAELDNRQGNWEIRSTLPLFDGHRPDQVVSMIYVRPTLRYFLNDDPNQPGSIIYDFLLSTYEDYRNAFIPYSASVRSYSRAAQLLEFTNQDPWGMENQETILVPYRNALAELERAMAEIQERAIPQMESIQRRLDNNNLEGFSNAYPTGFPAGHNFDTLGQWKDTVSQLLASVRAVLTDMQTVQGQLRNFISRAERVNNQPRQAMRQDVPQINALVMQSQKPNQTSLENPFGYFSPDNSTLASLSSYSSAAISDKASVQTAPPRPDSSPLPSVFHPASALNTAADTDPSISRFTFLGAVGQAGIIRRLIQDNDMGQVIIYLKKLDPLAQEELLALLDETDKNKILPLLNLQQETPNQIAAAQENPQNQTQDAAQENTARPAAAAPADSQADAPLYIQ